MSSVVISLFASQICSPFCPCYPNTVKILLYVYNINAYFNYSIAFLASFQ